MLTSRNGDRHPQSDGLADEPKARDEAALFRQQALDHAYSAWGNVARAPGVASWILTLFMVALLAVALLFLILGHYSRRETVQGALAPTAGALRVIAPHQGTVSAVHVRQGDLVRRGAPLFTLSTDPILPINGSVGEQLWATSDRQKQALQQEDVARTAANGQQRKANAAERAGLATRRSRLASDLELAKAQVVLRQQTLQSAEMLVRQGYFSAMQFRQRQEAVIEAQRQVSSIEREQEEASMRRAQLDALDGQLVSEAKIGAAQARAQGAQLDEKRVTLSASREVSITAPRDGRIATLNVKPGVAIESAAALAVIVPASGELEAELWAPSRAAGFIRAGAHVRLMYDAFPYQRFGAADGEVVSIANTPTPPNELTTPIQTPEALYRVTVRLKSQSVQAYGKAWPLTAGARLNADIVLEKRSFLEWILEPILAIERRRP